MAAVLKTAVRHDRTVGSNPTLPAKPSTPTIRVNHRLANPPAQNTRPRGATKNLRRGAKPRHDRKRPHPTQQDLLDCIAGDNPNSQLAKLAALGRSLPGWHTFLQSPELWASQDPR